MDFASNGKKNPLLVANAYHHCACIDRLGLHDPVRMDIMAGGKVSAIRLAV
jgi:hypothetical protein